MSRHPAAPAEQGTVPALGVVLVTFNSADVILDCLETLLASRGVALRIVVVDNASGDGTPDLIRNWAAGDTPAPLADVPFETAPATKPVTLHGSLSGRGERVEDHAVTLMETGANLGFAGGVNRGLAELAACPGIERFWVLNPDTVSPPETAAAFATAPVPEGGFSLMGGRLLYVDSPDLIQLDGGTINWRTGITGNLNLFRSASETPSPGPEDFAFVTGASMVASRAFYERIGPMREDYFLYYEEVDWAMRRGDLPFAVAGDAVVYHRAGTSIGSRNLSRPASPFAMYFKHRARMMFLRRFRPGSVATGIAWSLAKAGQLAAKGFPAEARALLAGAFGRPPPGSVASQLSPEARARVR